MVKKANINWTAKQITKMIEKNSISFDNTVQRGYVWDVKRKSLLINSMIEGYPIPPFYAAKSKNGDYDMLDGKQRCEAINGFINNKFVLTDTPEVKTEEGEYVDLNGLTFEKLPEDFQDAVKDYSLTIYYFDDIDDEEINSLFFRLNNGKPLSAIELTRVKAKSIDTIKEIGTHPIFTDALTAKALNRYTNEDIVIKSWAILNMENPSFETKKIRPVMKQAEITPEQKENIETAFTRILDAYKVIKAMQIEDKKEKKQKDKSAKRIFTRTHLITIVPLALDSVKENLSVEIFANWCVHFFSGKQSASISDIYNDNARAGSARAEAIRKRLDAVTEDYKQFVKVTNEVKQTDKSDKQQEPTSEQNDMQADEQDSEN